MNLGVVFLSIRDFPAKKKINIGASIEEILAK